MASSLPHKEWRAHLDTILDGYMRTHVTTDATEYMVDRMEEVMWTSSVLSMDKKNPFH